MGVADNRTYKNEYLFNEKQNSVFGNTGSTKGDNPSINADPKINTTIKENPYRSNVEIEGREVVLQPDLTALFKAVGKRHSQGGMDVLLKPDAFIFSDFKDLALSPQEHDKFELKKGGKAATDTPAEVLKRNIDMKHYNGLVNNLKDVNKDDLAKKSSARMLDKYISTLGNIAFIQEQKKGFPQGLPTFSEGTAPVYDADLKEDIMETKQYAKAGGTVNNPYMQVGGRKDKYTGLIPPYPATWHNYYDTKQHKQYTAPSDVNPVEFYNFPGVLDYMNTLDKINGVDNDLHKADDTVWGYRHQMAYDNVYNRKKPEPTPVLPPDNTPHDWGADTPTPDKGPSVPDVTGNAQGSKQANWKFTPWQNRSHLYDWAQWANVNKYMPDRAHYNATFTNPALVNPEQAVGDAKAAYNQNLKASNVLNPILRNAQGAEAYGQMLNTIPGIRSQYDNQNVGIINQFRQYNNQIKNNESMVNMQNDKEYSRDRITGNVNYDNMKTFLSNKAMSNTMSDVSNNQKLAYDLLTRNNPAYNFDWNTGNFTRNNKSILDASTGSAKSDMYTELAQTIMTKIKKGQNPTPEEVQFMKSLAVGKLDFSGTNGVYKKGGTNKRNPYK